MATTRVTRLVDLNLTRNALGVDHAVIVELKSLCRASDEAIFALFQALMGKMTATHPIPRLLALLVADVFFQRSSLFRTLMIGELNEFFELTLGISVTNRPLPPPAKSATYLRAEAVRVWRGWYHSFGAQYRVMGLAHNFLRDQHGLVLVDPVEVERARDSAAHRRRTVQQRALRVRWQRLHREFENGVRDECHATMAQVDSCLDLLVAAWSAHQQNHHQQLQQSSGGTSFRDSISGQSATAVASEAESSTSSSSTSQPFMSDAALDSLLDDSLWDNEDDDAHVEDAAGEATSPSAIRPTSLFSSSSSSFLAEPMQPATQAPSVLRNLMMTHGLPANVPMDEQITSLFDVLRDCDMTFERRLLPWLAEAEQTLLRLDWRFEVDDTYATAPSSSSAPSSSTSDPLYSASAVFDIVSPASASTASPPSSSSSSSSSSVSSALHRTATRSISSSSRGVDAAGNVSFNSVDAGTAAREAAQTAMLGRVGSLARDIHSMREQCAKFFAATRASRQISSAASTAVPTTVTTSSGRQYDHNSSGSNENEYDDDIDALFDEPPSVDEEVIGARMHKRAKQEANSPSPASSNSAAATFDPFAISDEDEGCQSQGSDDEILDCTGVASPSAASSSSSASTSSAASVTPAEALRARPVAVPLPPGWSRLTPQQRVEQTMKRLSRDMKRKR